jgi:hypothetical protein
MRALTGFAFLLAGLALAPAAHSQSAPPPAKPEDQGLGEVLVTANRQNAAYAQQNRPVVGLRRRADAGVMSVYVTSDTRDAAERTKEIYTVMEAVIDRAAAAGIQLVVGNVPLRTITRANYKNLPVVWAGRLDTGKIEFMLKAPLESSAFATRMKLAEFIKSVKGAGRGTFETGASIYPADINLTVVNPDQYRDAVIRLVADDARKQAAVFGPDFTPTVAGIDGPVAWSQVSSTDVFLYLPYSYSIGANK